MLIETPSRILDLSEYPEQNREDVQAYIQRNLTPNPARKGDRSEELIARLTTESENNFMYLHYILNALRQGIASEAQIAEGFYSKPFQFDRTEPSLEVYYQQH